MSEEPLYRQEKNLHHLMITTACIDGMLRGFVTVMVDRLNHIEETLDRLESELPKRRRFRKEQKYEQMDLTE